VQHNKHPCMTVSFASAIKPDKTRVKHHDT
jgi:hypothetical protein